MSIGDIIEPATDFDFEAADDPEGVALEELRGIASRMRLGIYIHPKHARICLAWAAARGVGPAKPILERVGLWLGGTNNMGALRCTLGFEELAPIALRTAVLIREFAPTACHAYNIRQLGDLFGITKQGVYNHSKNLRRAVFAPHKFHICS